jgi:hypothetical protein
MTETSYGGRGKMENGLANLHGSERHPTVTGQDTTRTGRRTPHFLITETRREIMEEAR